MKKIILILVGVAGIVSTINAEVRSYNYQVLVDTVATTSSEPAYTPTPPAVVGAILSGVIQWDDAIPDTNPAVGLGTYGNGFNSPTNSFSFLGVRYPSGTGITPFSTGATVADGQPVTIGGQTYNGDTVSMGGLSRNQGPGGFLDVTAVDWVLNDKTGAWLSSDALPTVFPSFGVDFTGQLSFSRQLSERVAIPGPISSAYVTSTYALTAHFISVTPVPEPSMGVLCMLGIALRLRRAR
jgi:hypothetical protein